MISGAYRFLRPLFSHRQLILAMARREVAGQYVGSILGFLWTFIQPAVMICVFWFVFSVGFKTQPMNGVPFVVWLTAGLAPWFLFSDIITKASGSVVAHGHLIKKTVFPSQILTVVKVFTAMVTHTVFLALLVILIIFQKMTFSLYAIQFFYYLACLSLLGLGLGWILSSLNVFIRDIAQIVGVAIQVGFWVTPIFWDIHMMSPKVQALLKLNPVYYVVQGYRDSFIDCIPFWHRPYYTLYYWAITFICLAVGIYVFRRLKGHFADVL
jgi:lipopolysaccharide transport system permease protein/teichoic acid transport system permease protein